MAKVAKVKKREASVHSRAYRRQATPPQEITKSSKSDENDQQWMHSAQNAGVHKKVKAKTRSTRQQHVRHAKALERADRNSAVLESKVEKSKIRGRRVQARAKDWDELNEELAPKKNDKVSTATTNKEESTAMDGLEDDGPDVPTAAQHNDMTNSGMPTDEPLLPASEPATKTVVELDVVT